MIPTWSTSAAAAHITYPPASLLDIFPPAPEPTALAAPKSDHTLARPFDIDPGLYNNLLRVEWPLTIAVVYGITVYFLNKANRQRDNKPWAIGKSSIFYAFVLLHNIFLAAFSLWTFVGMFHAIRQTWPGLHGENKWAAAADALCKMHGPRGLGSAATFNPTTSSWGFTDRVMKLLDGSPDYTDVGRLWNEGLGFYGWLFYVSKFYEIVDTLIILAKGKNTSILQTFHHAGAMMCMWAGIRYMSPPIWMFVFVNSGLHGLMYIYYTLSSLEIKVPLVLKRVLTSLQITQFVFGASYALAHLFIAYDIPVSVPYLFIHNLSSAIPKAASSVSSAVASATATANLSNWLKKAALRAAGEEGLAMNVRNDEGDTFGVDSVHAAESEKSQEEIRYRMEYQTIHCLDTSGQVFAILLNVLYLAPLTILFLQFFVRNYILGTRKNVPPASRTEIARKSAEDAIHDLEVEIKKAVEDQEHNDEMDIPPEFKANIDKAKSSLEDLKSAMGDIFKKPRAKAGEAADIAQKKADELNEAAHEALKEATDRAKNAKTDLRDGLAAIKEKAQAANTKMQQKGGELKEQAGQKATALKDQIARKAGELKEEAEEKVSKVRDEAEDKSNAVKDEAESVGSAVKDEAKSKGNAVKEEAENKGNAVKDEAEHKGNALKAEAGNKGNAVKDEAENEGNAVKDEAENKGNAVKDEAEGKAEEAKDTAKDAREKAESEAKFEKPAQNGKVKEQKSKIPKRDKSPVKRDPSPVKSNASQPGYDAKPKGKENLNGEDKSKDDGKADGAGKDKEPVKDEGKGDADGTNEEKNETNGLDESAYEINADELKNEQEAEAEAEMQPKKE